MRFFRYDSTRAETDVSFAGANDFARRTTLLEELVATGSWDNTQLRVGPSMQIGYCAQKRERFAPGTSVTNAMLPPGHSTRNEIFGVLTRLNFVREDLHRPVESLSGGERNRLQLGIAIVAKRILRFLTSRRTISTSRAAKRWKRRFMTLKGP